ncbi:hypothetical protein [Dactylosporangium sp. CA-092794]|uniref:hypothetical protein n=1 Tax=Dactylosporangium sp. CA-092794 TaxID=3239929 RepID=UPI003D8A0BC5
MLTAGPVWTASADSPQTQTQTPAPLLGGAEEVLILTHHCDLAFVEECVRPARAAGARITVLYDATTANPPTDNPAIGNLAIGATGNPATGMAGNPAKDATGNPVTGSIVGNSVMRDGGSPVDDLLPIPVVCRSGGAFRARVVISASPSAAAISIGSGDATADGWQGGATAWTHLNVGGATVPTLVTDLAEWLVRLPEQLWIEPMGVERLAAVARLLTARPHVAEPDEPLLLTNDLVPIVEQLPFPSGADRLSVSAAAFDPAGRALAEIMTNVRPARVRVLLPAGVRCDPDGLTRALAGRVTELPPGGPAPSNPAAPANPAAAQVSLQTPTSQPYLQIGALEWWADGAGVLVSGGLDCTPEALLCTSADPGGNCELALLQEVTASLLDVPEARETALDDPDLRVCPAETLPPPVPRVLGVRLHGDRVEASLVAPGTTAPDGLVVSAGEAAIKLPWTGAEGRLHVYSTEAPALETRTAQVRAADGAELGTVLVTDVVGAVTRFSHPSPLESLSVAAVLADPGRLDALFAAIAQLASGRTARHGEPPAQRRAREEARLRSIVGPALLDLAFGRTVIRTTGTDKSGQNTINPEGTNALATGTSGAAGTAAAGQSGGGNIGGVAAQSGGNTGNAAGQSSGNVDGAAGQSGGGNTGGTAAQSSGNAGGAAGGEAGLAAVIGALEPARRDQVRQQVLRLGGAAVGWPLPARLAAFRVVLVLAAGGLWPAPQDWTPLVAAGLDSLIAAGDEAFAAEQAALATVGIAAVHHGHLLAPLAGFEDLRAAVRLDQEAPQDLVERYADGLAGAVLGERFRAEDITADAGELLVRSAFDDAVDAIPGSVGVVQRGDGGGVLVETTKDPRRTTLLVLDLLRDFPDTHVTVRGTAGTETHGWWNGRRLVLLTPFGGRWRGSLWPGLMTGIATYAKGASPLPPAGRTWITEVPQLEES